MAKEVYSKDLDNLIKFGSIEQVALNYMNEVRSVSFNSDKVHNNFENYHEFNLLIYIANGIFLDVDSKFNILNKPPSFRKLQVQLLNTYKKSCLKLWNKGKGILYPIDKVPKEVLFKCHFSDLHCTVKPGNKDGRILFDVSNGPKGYCLNTPEVKLAGIKRFGKVVLPSLKYIFSQWILFCQNNNILLINCYIWKYDISGAFTQLWFNPAFVYFFATKVDEEFMFLHLCGYFGWCNMPKVWGAVSSALERMIILIVLLSRVQRILINLVGKFGIQ